MDQDKFEEPLANASPAEIIEIARANYLAHKYDEALTVVDRLLKFAARGYSVRALCLAEMGQPEEGLRAAEMGVAADPTDAVVLTSRAFCKHRLGDNVGADDDYHRAMELDPGNYKVFYNYACYWAERNNEGECRRYLEMAVELMSPGNRSTMLEDPDLARFREAEWFRELAARAKARTRNAAGMTARGRASA